MSELGSGYRPLMKPLEFERTESFTVRPDGKFELIVYNPIIFADVSDRSNTTAVGTCGMSSVLEFNSDMQLESLTQTVVPAKILEE